MEIVNELISQFVLVNKLIVFLINAIGLELALWVYFTNRKQRANQLFFFFTLCLVLWIDFDFLSTFAPFLVPEASVGALSLAATRFVFAILCPFFLFIHLFSIYFPKPGKRHPAVEALFAGVWAALFALSFTGLIIKEVSADPIDAMAVRIVPGLLLPVYVAAALISFAAAAKNFFAKNRLLPPQERLRYFHLFLALGLFGAFNILFNVIFPVYSNLYLGLVSLLGDYSIIFLLGFTAYYVLKERLFGIKVILVEIMVGLMGAILAVMPFLIDVVWQRTLLFVLFSFFCLFSYLLVKGTISEYREKEKLEMQVKNRTQELEEAKETLEEMNAILEIRVNARTEELRKLNQTLEEKVKERTSTLREKIEDLEKFQRLTVGRELKMIELKKEIDFQRQKIGQLEEKSKRLSGKRTVSAKKRAASKTAAAD